jgi:predicted dehydrogenase/acetyltransferase-like isoleucine patch superfamily enzyme
MPTREPAHRIHEPSPTRHNPQLAVIGFGYWGTNLIRNFHQLGALKLVCDENNNVLKDFNKQYPEVDVCATFADVFVHKDIEGVVIATPAETHFSLAREALSGGKHVFVEKPLSLAEEEGQELVELAERNQLTLMVGHILQYHPAVIKLKELIDSGELGKIQYLYSNRLNIGKIRAEENILWSFAPHDISAILMLLEEMPKSVCATGGSYLQQHIPDTTLTTLEFPSGVQAHVFVSWLHPFKEQKLVVVGDRKMAVFDDLSEEKLLLYPHKIQWFHRMPVAAKADAEVVKIDMEEPLKVECQHFLECVSSRTRPKTDGREGLRVLRVLQASQQSLNENGCKITIHDRSPKPPSIDSVKSYDSEANRYFVHESAYIDDDVRIGVGTKIWHFSHVLSGSIIGEHCNIGQNVVIGPDVTIGNGCKIQNNVSVYKGVTLEDNVFCGPSMVFTNVHNPRAHIRRMDELHPTLVKKGATLGANCTVVCGHTIGRYAFLGAGAVITKDVPDYALVVGVPARIVGWVCECGEKLHFAGEQTRCKACSRHYRLINNEMVESQVE